jgi:hypothetical protein|tara:strand:+ start:162 stop:413 length:252 start_codon:yes stop_codon:yes gene_type:complete
MVTNWSKVIGISPQPLPEPVKCEITSLGNRVFEISLPRLIKDEKEVRNAILTNWGGGPYKVANITIYGNIATFTTHDNYVDRP